MRPSELPAWLAVEGWCSPTEGDALCAAAGQAGGQVLEVGAAMGRSAIALALSGADVVTIDSDAARLAACAANAARCGVRLEVMEGDSRALAQAWDRPIALLYIDGWHDAANVRADYAAWAPHVSPGGAIWFHDAYGAGWPDVQTVIDQILAAGEATFDGYVGTIATLRKAGA